MSLRIKTLLLLNKLFPIKVDGNAEISDWDGKYKLSCIINFYKRTNLLKNILSSLEEQNIEKTSFEVVLVEDRGGSPEGEKLADDYGKSLNINYYKLDKNYGVMGYARNFGMSKSRGKYLLFLDDDTVILQSDFLEKLLYLFDKRTPDVIVPRGISSYCVLNNKYQYHDPYFPTNRCTAYKRESIKELGGFISEFVGQEDVEITVRLYCRNKKIYEASEIEYFHPPLIYLDTKKGASVGFSIAKLFGKYPTIILIALIINGCRHLPFIFFPFNTRMKNQAIFSLGFFKGVIGSFSGGINSYE